MPNKIEYQKYKKRLKVYNAAYRKAHLELYNKASLEFYYKNRSRILERQRRKTAETKRDVLVHYSLRDSPQCAHCGIDDVDVLCIDHVDGCGNLKRRTYGAGSGFYIWLKKNNYPRGFQVLCANCNLKKEILRKRGEPQTIPSPQERLF